MAGRSPYAKGHSVGLCVNDSCDKPLTIPLTPEYVRELVDDPDCEAALLDRAERMMERKEPLPDWLSRKIIRMGRMGRFPRTAWHARKDIWRRGYRHSQDAVWSDRGRRNQAGRKRRCHRGEI